MVSIINGNEWNKPMIKWPNMGNKGNHNQPYCGKNHILEPIDHKYSKKQDLNAMDARLSWIKLMDLVILTWIRLIESKLSWINLKKVCYKLFWNMNL